MADAARTRVLVVEDEWLIAEYVGDLLERMGFEVLGPAPNVAQALACISSDTPDAAILDISLGRESSLAVADELMRRDVPFVFASGYVTTDLPQRYCGCKVLAKPICESDLREKIRGLVDRRSGEAA